VADEIDTRLEPQSLHVTPTGLLLLAGIDKSRVESFGFLLNQLGQFILQRMQGRAPAMVWVGGHWTIVSAETADVTRAIAETRTHREVVVRAADPGLDITP
jgi:hypothetical protein